MSLEKKDFFGKTVADVIKQACDTLQVPQEHLDIEVIETGSTGIFGFIRKKAHIRARVKEAVSATKMEIAPPVARKQTLPVLQKPAPATKKSVQQAAISTDESIESETLTGEDEEEDFPLAPSSEEPLSQESIDGVQHELTLLLQLMGLPSKVEIEAQGSSVRCHIIGDFEEDLTGQEGKILDSLQYLLRKITARKISERVRISIDVGDFREKRQDELQDLARELATLVKADGKTQVIPSLNPSERRVVHMALQDDKEIRSRSVGDGLFKKILIYKPGKAKTGGNTADNPKKRPSSRGRRRKGSKPTTESGENE
ncbi:MAG: Jag N-terminal domain-containing protein [Deltaproteobacteria bacterium]|nr:Jag N-terminal domain-containing protein [Deltaproteobacteria bacterium]